MWEHPAVSSQSAPVRRREAAATHGRSGPPGRPGPACRSLSGQLRPRRGASSAAATAGRKTWSAGSAGSAGLLRAAALLLGAAGAEGVYFGSPGILAEYFTLLDSSCEVGGNGSVYVLDGLLPNITRKDNALQYQDAMDFGLDRCVFEPSPAGIPKQTCRGAGELRANFAARWTGYFGVQEAGMYHFEMEADDGARMVIGHGRCPGLTCGTREDVMNSRMGDLPLTLNKESPITFARECQECMSGIYDNCFVSDSGCEPFSLWQLEGDNGFNGTCASGNNVYHGSRFLSVGRHPFRIEYFNRGGDARFILRWQGPDSSDRMVPIPGSSYVFPDGAGLNAEWYKLVNLPQFLPPVEQLGAVFPGARLVRRVDDLFEDLAEKSEWSKAIEALGPAMVRWTGFLDITTGGTYTFRLRSDDGSRIVIAGRGMTGETVLVNNDGIKDQPVSSEATVEMLPGKSAIRIEYLHSPGAPGPYGDTGLPKPPHIEVFYSGPDTGFEEDSIGRLRAAALSRADIECSMKSWAWGKGMTYARDCSGKCFDGNEALIGDYICDNGETTQSNFYCQAFDFDSSDCIVRQPPVLTTPRPANPCFVSCPAGDWSRKDCKQCALTQDGLCVEETLETCENGPNDPPGHCNFGRCCVAKFDKMEYWDRDCLAFGAYDDCSVALERLLSNIGQQPRSLASLSASRSQDVAKPKASVIVDCEGDLCNAVPDEKERNPYTGRLTDDLICRVEESKKAGLECFEGPWVDTNPTPLDDCQGENFKYNFCLNRKTTTGRPFRRCCTFLWVDSRMQPQCKFIGLEMGTCDYWLSAYKAQYAGDIFRAIDKETVLKDCDTGDRCNDPFDEEGGCPDAVVKRPRQVAHLIPEEVDLEALLQGGGEAPPEPIPWGMILIPIAGILFFGGAAYVVVKLIKDPERPLFHSDKAKVVQDDTFVEPQQDLDAGNAVVDGVAYGVVHPRPHALRMILKEQRQQNVPRALRKDPALTMGGITDAAYEARLAIEASVKGMPIERFREIAEMEGVVSPATGLPRELAIQAIADLTKDVPLPRRRSEVDPVALAALVDAAAEEVSENPDERDEHDEALAVEDDPSAGKDSGGLPLQLADQLPGQVVERTTRAPSKAPRAALPGPPPDNDEDLLRQAAMLAEAQALAMPPAAPGAVSVVEALRASTTVGATKVAVAAPSAGRPAATARMLRQGGAKGPPRVCT